MLASHPTLDSIDALKLQDESHSFVRYAPKRDYPPATARRS